MKRLAVMSMALASAAGAGELPLQLKGEGAYYGLRIPLDVRAQATADDLGDLRVLNAAGEAVPYAWVDAEPGAVATPTRQSVPLFKAPPPPASAASTAEPAQQGGWIVDLRAVKGLPQELQLDVAPGTNGVFPFVLEASADLQRWHTVLPQAQLVALQHQGLRLEHSHFELATTDGGPRGGYLRLRPLPGSPPAPLTGARVASLAHRAELPDWQWSDTLTPSECKAEHCDYVLPRHLPLQRIEFTLAEPNTLARVQLLGQPDDEAAPANSRVRHHHPVRDHLKVLRHKNAPSPTQKAEAFWPLTSGTVYALNLQGSALRSTVLSLPGGLYRKLRVQPTGGMAQLGSKPPSLRVGGRAASLVFLARGAGPYRLAWDQTSPSVVMPLAQLMPGRRPDDPLPEATAVVAPRVAPAALPVAPSTPASVAAPGDSNHKPWLWAALLGALGLMGFMAWSLLRPAAEQGG
jgi:hypothetical protein